MQDKSHYTRYNYKKLYELAVEMFIRYGFSREDSEKVADVILTSDRFGVESHGVNRLTLYPFGIDIGRIKVDAKPEVVEDRLSMAVIDAHDGMGQLASIQGMQLAIDKAKKYGVGMVSVRNSNHFGIAGYYSMMAAKQGLMGVSMTNAEALVVPTYAREPMFGTNPIAVTIPADPHPFHMDFATSVMTCGKMEVYAKIGHELQPGMLVDETGTTCLDPNVFLRIRDNKSNPAYTEKTRGGIMPMGGEGMLFGGHKGYGLSLLVELFCGILSGGRTSNEVRVVPNVDKVCHFFMAVDYSIFGDKEQMEKRFSQYLEDIRNSALADGQTRIYTHGDKAYAHMARVAEEGVKVNDKTYDEIVKICQDLGIDPAEYLIEKAGPQA